jgi:ABC-type amino acid transport substrate-binding protein
MNSNPIGSIVALALVVFAGSQFSGTGFDLGGATSAVARESIACSTQYRVVRGDTLHKIATRAYGIGNYQVIAVANSATLPDIAKVEIGDELVIPCLDGVMPRIGAPATNTPAIKVAALDNASVGEADIAPPATTATASALLPDHSSPDHSSPDHNHIGFVTGSDFAPFAHSALPEGGMTGELVRLAMASSARQQAIKVAVVEDWVAHLDLLEQGEFDLGFPWYRPDCSRMGNLSASMQRRCADFDFSDPLFEVVMAYYVQVADPLAEVTGYDQLWGRRICRPANYFTFDLEQEGLAAPNATIVIGHDAVDCFNRLVRGNVDVASLSKPLAQEQIVGLGFDSQVAEIPALASVQTLHVVAPKGAPGGRASLDLINTGLAGMQSSGRWSEVVSRHLGAYGMRMN